MSDGSKSLFITGSGGFIGTQLINRIDASQYDTIYCLIHELKNAGRQIDKAENIKVVSADLLDVEKYRSLIASCDTVVHLAAATGKVDAERYVDVNVRGTQALIDLCEQEKVTNFLHVSTIAVKYPDKSYYPYAQTKEQSEQIVKSSQLKYAIIRPTIVIGENGSTWMGLMRLGKAPIIPIFGDGTAKVQPVYIDDLLTCLLSILEKNLFNGDIFEIGGPQIGSFEEFLGEIHRSYRGSKPRFIRLPYKPIKNLLAWLENSLIPIPLPIGAGQLSVFGNDGTITENEIYSSHVAQMKDVPEMINLVLQKESAISHQAMLERECIVYTKYLVNQSPTDYVIGKYYEAHSKLPDINRMPDGRFQKILLNLSAKSPFMTRVVDSYSSLFIKNSVIQKKIILLLAILENSAPSYEKYDKPDSTNIFILFLSLALHGIYYVFTLLLSLLLFIPLSIALKILRK